ncbi:hypothetical protein [Nocardia otitidiscaviarum]|uniref:hypothetical protein n=1 Tax=Nocardia otitidiscaviarum TaxID=1823 RepID=UPI0011DD8921|nr:hypothetical protein [Nocardia otitidiscaviarum]
MTRQIVLQQQNSRGQSTLTLPEACGKLVYWLKPSPIPGTPAWEWVICNIACNVMPGMTAGYADDEASAIQGLRAALTFWRSHGYDTADLPEVPE